MNAYRHERSAGDANSCLQLFDYSPDTPQSKGPGIAPGAFVFVIIECRLANAGVGARA